MEKQGLTSDEYIAKVLVSNNVDDKTKEDMRRLLQIAMETRQFEIKLYWKRAQYFWLFVSLCFVAYYKTAEDSYESEFRQWENLLATIGGYILSLCWFFLNRGSKYWQENWEKHIAVLSKHMGTPIFELLKSNKNHSWNLMSSYPYSVSRLNQILNIVIIVIWFILLSHIICTMSSICCCMRIVVFAILVVSTWLIHHFSRSFVMREATNHDKDFFSNISST